MPADGATAYGDADYRPERKYAIRLFTVKPDRRLPSGAIDNAQT